MGVLFGTDGVRGVANRELTAELAFKLGRAGAFVLAEETHHKPKILVGMDTRISGDMLESALVAGICSTGAHAHVLGVVPTPAVAYLTRKYKADCGIVISASHNPYEFNGIKFFNSKGYKLSDETENRIEDHILGRADGIPSPEGEQLGRKVIEQNAIRDYIDYAKSTLDTDFKGLKVALDCANGASFVTSPKTFEELNCEVYTINDTPNGVNINKDCGSTHMNSLCKFVLENKCDLGIAFDGDADRVLFVDENGRLIDGDRIMAILGLDLKNRGLLKGDTIVATVMSNLGLDIAAKQNNINLLKTKVGDRYVLEEMLKNDFVLGGEQSGHIIFLEYNTTGDGLITALQLVKVVKNSGKKLSELADIMDIYPQVLINAKVCNSKKYDFRNDEIISMKCKELEDTFHGEGRVLIRPSGTEPLVRVMIEGKDIDFITNKAKELAILIEERLK